MVAEVTAVELMDTEASGVEALGSRRRIIPITLNHGSNSDRAQQFC